MSTPHNNTDYYAVIFYHQLSGEDVEGYYTMNEHLAKLSESTPGYLGKETMSDEEGTGLSVLYWESLEAIDTWRTNTDHMQAKEKGASTWYDRYRLRIAHVIYDKEFER